MDDTGVMEICSGDLVIDEALELKLGLISLLEPCHKHVVLRKSVEITHLCIFEVQMQ